LKIIFLLTTFFTVLLTGAELITPIPETIHYNKAKADLGKQLFFDVRLSKDNTISCASCHDLSRGGVDRLQFSFGVDGQKGSINTPTVYNALFNDSQFWDGRAKTLEEQAKGPIHNPKEMGTDLEAVVEKLKKDPQLVTKFQNIYNEKISPDNILNAIAEFEKALFTPNSRFDKYLRGEAKALTKKEREGFELFKSHGCISCHNGVNIGGNLYHKFGIIKPFKETTEHVGRYVVTKEESDKYVFKVPTLRNVSMTGPYFHTGETKDLKTAIKVMGEYQLGKALSKNEIEKIYSFLLTLTGETPKIVKEYIE